MKRHSFPRRQQGQYLILAVVSLAIASGLVGLVIHTQRTTFQASRMAGAGSALAQMGTGLRGYIAAVQDGKAPAGTFNGVNFLKPPTCGGAAGNPVAGYVPCAFDGGEYGPQYHTVVTSTPAPPGGPNVLALTTFKVGTVGTTTSSGATPQALAAGIAFNARAASGTPLGGTYINAISNVPVTATTQLNPAQEQPNDAGNVGLVVENAPSNDIYLRVDGTNQMLADLNVGGHAIQNATNGNFSNTVSAGKDVCFGASVSPTGAVTRLPYSACASQGVYDIQSYKSLAPVSVPMPRCPSGEAPHIFAFYQSLGTLIAGYAISGSNLGVVASGATWTVTPQIFGFGYSQGQGTLNGSYDQATGAVTVRGTINLDSKTTAAFATPPTFGVITKCS